jgi:hypothetical protein
MLTHKAIGPDAQGKYSVGYPTPGTTAYTVVLEGCTAGGAADEAARLNRQQLATERALHTERRACGLRGMHLPLNGKNCKGGKH